MYSYTQLKEDVNNRIHAKIGRILDARNAINSGVRRAALTPLKTLRRKYSVPVRILEGVYDYVCPTDIQGHKIIDLIPTTETRSLKAGWINTHPEAFDRLRGQGKNVITVTNNGTSRVLRATAPDSTTKVTLSACDSLTADGTWAVIGTASNIALDTTTYAYGTGSIKFDIGAGTSDGIYLDRSTVADIDDYRADGSCYLSLSLPSVSGVTGATIRLGSDSSNYLSISVTADVNGNALTAGFNLLKFKLSDGTATGSPDYDNIDYIAVKVDKDTTTLTGVRIDRILVGSGSQYELHYISRYPWQTSGGTWIENSTVDTDVLVAETEEYNLIVEACVAECAMAAREYDDADRAELRFKNMVQSYRMANPDCSIPLTSDWWKFNSQN